MCSVCVHSAVILPRDETLAMMEVRSGVTVLVKKIQLHCLLGPLAFFTKEINPSLAKPPLKFSGGFAKLGLTFLDTWLVFFLHKLVDLFVDVNVAPSITWLQ